MKKNFFFCLAFILLFFTAKSQLSGNYTIGPTSTYKTFNEAIKAVIIQGFINHVIFYVEPGVYQEQLYIPDIGAGSGHMLMFQAKNGDSSSVILKYKPKNDSDNFTVLLDGAKYIYFNKITMATDTTFGQVIVFANSCSNNIFANNRIMGQPQGRELVYSDNIYSSTDNNNTFTNNQFINGSVGIYFQGNSDLYENNNIFNGNHFTNQSEGGLFLQYENITQVTNNVIVTNSNNPSVYGISCNNFSNSLLIEKNKISLENPGINSVGIKLFMTGGTSLAHNLVSNNFIHINTTDFASGIQSICPNMDFLYNSINMTGNSNSSCALDLVLSDGIEVADNVFTNNAGGYAMLISDTTGTISHHNSLYTTGPFTASWNMTDYTTLDNFRNSTKLEKNSVSINPVFTSSSDLHTNSVFFNNLGSPHIRVTKDIDGQVRNSVTPDIGADEFNAVFDLGPDRNLCSKDSLVLDAGAGFDSYLWSDGSKSQKLLLSVKKTGYGNFKIKVTAKYKTAQFSDSLTVHINPDPVYSLGPDRNICHNSFTWFLAPDSLKYLWSTGDTSRSLLIEVKDTAIYWLKLTSKKGCKTSDSIKINAIPLPYVNLGKDSILCAGQSVSLDAGAGMDSILWSDHSTGRTISVDTNGRGIGKFRIKVKASKLGCSSIDSIDLTFKLCTSLEDHSINRFCLYPNPVYDLIHLTVPESYLDAEYRISDMTGHTVTSGKVKTINSSIKLNNLTAGSYFILLKKNNLPEIARFFYHEIIK